MKYNNALDATIGWIKEWNQVPTSLINRANVNRNIVEMTEISSASEFPIWDTMYSFKAPSDIEWLLAVGAEIMNILNVRVYQDKESNTYWFGIDEAEGNFLDKYWEKLYKARGLNWHKK